MRTNTADVTGVNPEPATTESYAIIRGKRFLENLEGSVRGHSRRFFESARQAGSIAAGNSVPRAMEEAGAR